MLCLKLCWNTEMQELFGEIQSLSRRWESELDFTDETLQIKIWKRSWFRMTYWNWSTEWGNKLKQNKTAQSQHTIWEQSLLKIVSNKLLKSCYTETLRYSLRYIYQVGYTTMFLMRCSILILCRREPNYHTVADCCVRSLPWIGESDAGASMGESFVSDALS